MTLILFHIIDNMQSFLTKYNFTDIITLWKKQ